MSKKEFRILHVIAPGPIAGAEKSALASVRALHSDGYQVDLAIIKELRKPECAEDFLSLADDIGVNIQLFSTPKRLDFGMARRLREFVVRNHYSVVHSHSYKALLHLSLFRREISFLVATFHGSTSHTLAVRLYEWLEWILYQQTDCVFAVSEGAKVALENKGRLRCRVAVVPNFISPPGIKKRGREEDSPLRLLYLGRLSPEKGADVLIRAMRGVGRRYATLDIVGDGPERGRLQKMITDLDLKETVSFHGFQQDVDRYLESADVLVMPSLTEGLPMSLLEATSTGMPVIASKVGGIPEILNHGKNGLLVAPDNPNELSHAIEKMHQNFGTFDIASRDYARIIVKKYGPANWVRFAIDEYQNALVK